MWISESSGLSVRRLPLDIDPATAFAVIHCEADLCVYEYANRRLRSLTSNHIRRVVPPTLRDDAPELRLHSLMKDGFLWIEDAYDDAGRPIRDLIQAVVVQRGHQTDTLALLRYDTENYRVALDAGKVFTSAQPWRQADFFAVAPDGRSVAVAQINYGGDTAQARIRFYRGPAMRLADQFVSCTNARPLTGAVFDEYVNNRVKQLRGRADTVAVRSALEAALHKPATVPR